MDEFENSEYFSAIITTARRWFVLRDNDLDAQDSQIIEFNNFVLMQG